MPDLETFAVAHIKEPRFPESTETFVTARVLNPACRRPVPVLTHQAVPGWQPGEDIRLYELNSLAPLRRRIEYGLENRLHWSAYYYQVLSRLHPQLIHAHFSGAGEAAAWSARALGIPLIVNFYGIETKYHLHDPLWLPRYRRLFSQAGAFSCLNSLMKQTMVEAGCPAEKITVIPCGVDTSLFSGFPKEWRPEQRLRILSNARLHGEKGLEYLLQAGRLLNQVGFTGWDLQIIGTGPLESSLKNLAVDLQINEQVSFLGTKTPAEVANLLRQADMFILPSLKETQGVVLQEAQACCIPVIASRLDAVRGGIKEGESGLLTEPGSPEDLMEAIRTLVRNPERIPHMGAAGRAFVLEKFSREAEYRQLNEMYARVLTNQ